MISKIIALAIALVLLASAPIYGAIVTPSTPIEFGAGNGTSIVVETPEDLQKVIASIPDINSYLETENMTELDENFKSLTMVENGYGKTVQPRKTTLYVENEDGEIESYYVEQQNITKMSHVLEIAFGETGVYYVCTGENSTSVVNWELNENGNYTSNLVSAERSVTRYSFEIYYSKNTVLVKYNDFDIVNEECGFVPNAGVDGNDSESRVPYTAVAVDEEDDTAMLQKNTVTALSQCFGIWMQVELPEEGAEEDMPNYEDMENMTEEEQMQFYVDMLVEQLVYEYSTTMIQSFTQTNAQNIQYVKGLGTFMTEGAENFKKLGDRYMLKSTEAARDAYLATVIPTNASIFRINEYGTEVYFTTNDTTVDLVQVVALSGRYDPDTNRQTTDATAKIETVTTFKNVGNTVASVKNADIKTVKEVFEGPFGEMFRNMLESEEVENNG